MRGGNTKIYRTRLEKLRRELIRAGQEALRNEITERFADDGLLYGDQPAQSFHVVERIIESAAMKALFAANYKMIFVLMVKNVWSCRQCHNSWLYPRIRKWCTGRAQCPFDFNEYDGDSLYIDFSTSRINTLLKIATSEMKDVYDKIHKLERIHFGFRCFAGNTRDMNNGGCTDIITVPVHFSSYCVEGGKTYFLKFDKERSPRLANLCGDEDGSKKIWLTEDHLTVVNKTLL